MALSIRSSLSGTEESRKSKATPQVSSVPAFQNKTAVDNSQSFSFESATQVAISDPLQIARRAQESAQRSISNAASFVDVASDAVDAVSNLLTSAKSIAERLKTEVDPRKRAELAEDGAELITSIDTIASEASLNGQSVVNSGNRRFEFNLDPGNLQTTDTFSVNIVNVQATVSELNLSSVTESALSSDPTTASDTIEAARLQLGQTRASLDDSKQQIENLAERFGVKEQARADNPIQSEQEAEQVASQIQNSIAESSVASIPNNLDPLRVQDLLLQDEEEEAKKRAAIPTEEDQEDSSLVALTQGQ